MGRIMTPSQISDQHDPPSLQVSLSGRPARPGGSASVRPAAVSHVRVAAAALAATRDDLRSCGRDHDNNCGRAAAVAGVLVPTLPGPTTGTAALPGGPRRGRGAQPVAPWLAAAGRLAATVPRRGCSSLRCRKSDSRR